MSSGALLLQEQWLAGLVVAVVLLLSGASIRLLNAFIKDVEREKGLWNWRRTRYGVLEEREKFRRNQVENIEHIRMRKLEGEHERSEFKRSNSSRPDQLKLFRW